MNRFPTDEEHDAALAWLKENVPGWNAGMWAALAELLALHGSAPAPGPSLVASGPVLATPKHIHVFEVFDAKNWDGGEELRFIDVYASDAELLDAAALKQRQLAAARLAYVGHWRRLGTTRVFHAGRSYEDLPDWAQLWIDEQRAAEIAKAAPRARKGKAA